MADYGPGADYGSDYDSSNESRKRFAAEIKPHAYDPKATPELFFHVLPRRIVAFFIDMAIILVPITIAYIFIFIVGIVTLGLGFALFGLLTPASVIWALLYYGLTLRSPASATIGMRTMGLQMRTWYGAPAYFVLGAVHPILFWISVTMLTPLILIVGLADKRSRLLHDIVLGVVIINKPSAPSPVGTHVRPA